MNLFSKQKANFKINLQLLKRKDDGRDKLGAYS